MTRSDRDPRTPRSIELEVEVAGTPEEVWRAIATGPGITAWLHPTELEEREGGRMAYDMGDGMSGTAVVREWDPPRRYVEEAEWALRGQPDDAVTLATEWSVEAREGGTCVVRMVSSGFGAGASWDQEIEGFTEAMETALVNLRLYLAHFAGARGEWIRVFGHAPGSLEEGLDALVRALGLSGAAPGARVTASGPGAPPLAGVVEHLAEGRWQRHLLLRLERPAPGLASVGLWGEARTTTIQLCLYGDEGARVAESEAPAWRAWMEARFPAVASAA